MDIFGALHRPQYLALTVTAILLLAVSACFRGSGNQEAVAVYWDRDRDEFCGMVVSDRRFAAQVLEPQGRAHVFDDIGCLVLWLEAQPWRDQARIWVRDHHVDRWIDPDRALWRAGELTPSGYGFGASLENGYGTLTFRDVRREIVARRGQTRPAAPNPPSRPTPVRP